MTLPMLLIFYVSKWKNNKKHWKIGIWRHCDVIIGRGKSKLSVGLLCTEMIIVCKFHDPSIIGSRDTEGGSEEPPPQSQIDQKSPVWIGLNRSSSFSWSLTWALSAKYSIASPLLRWPFGLSSLSSAEEPLFFVPDSFSIAFSLTSSALARSYWTFLLVFYSNAMIISNRFSSSVGSSGVITVAFSFARSFFLCL